MGLIRWFCDNLNQIRNEEIRRKTEVTDIAQRELNGRGTDIPRGRSSTDRPHNESVHRKSLDKSSTKPS
ncbi:jg19387 [Pararge aegeria aegeria]|uniref:Jg19387 protein n=1 Tax=Pararge aegeria aegeria TaxID=348720 RepID=A0A8S4R8W6_9NEOP|nr:jg19387 [Pararge aegeria aegeria]